MSNPNQRAWRMVRAHARMHRNRTIGVPKAGLDWLANVARLAHAANPVAMAKAARRIWL